MSFLQNLNPFYWKKVADKCAAITTELVNKNARLTQNSVNLKQENRNLKRTVEDFTVDVKNQMALVNEELAYKIATGEIDPARAKLLLDIQLMKADVINANERFVKRDELLKAEIERMNRLREKLHNARNKNRKMQGLIIESESRIADLEAQIAKVNATNEKLRQQNNKWFELITGVGVDEGVILTSKMRGKKLVHVDFNEGVE